jgi:rhodanese-related sulfurtransferase
MKLPGSIRMMPPDVDISQLPRDREIVAYDSDPDELVSSRVAGDLIKAGYRAHALKGGIVEWLAANFPTETKEAPKQAAPEPGSLKG